MGEPRCIEALEELRKLLSEIRTAGNLPKWLKLENGEVVIFECGKPVPVQQ